MDDSRREIADLIAAGKKLEAAKLLNETTGCGLEQAVEMVEQLSAELVGEAPPGTAAVSDALSPEVESLARAGRKIEAIKRLREETGLGLKEAKERVDAFEEAHGLRRGGGCAPAVLVLALLAALGALAAGGCAAGNF